MGQDAALEEGVELVLHELRQIGPGGSFDLPAPAYGSTTFGCRLRLVLCSGSAAEVAAARQELSAAVNVEALALSLFVDWSMGSVEAAAPTKDDGDLGSALR